MKELFENLWNMPLEQLELHLLVSLMIILVPVGIYYLFKGIR